MITDEELDAIDARADATTPDWTVGERDGSYWVNVPDSRWGASGRSIIQVSPDDATFIAHARADVPRLTRELREERAAHADTRALFASTRAAEAMQVGCVAKLRGELAAAKAELARERKGNAEYVERVIAARDAARTETERQRLEDMGDRLG